MKVRINPHSDEVIYLRGETATERSVLSDMWEHGIAVFGGGNELAICSQKHFGSALSQIIEKGEDDE